MPFTTHLQSLNSVHDALASLEQPTQIQRLVRDATAHIIENCTIFNGCITLDTPFLREFVASINTDSLAQDEDSIFSFFECLVIFFREKRLRLGRTKLAAPEQAVLSYFETSGNWEPHDVTIVNEWYWHTLPRKIVEESVHSRTTVS